MKLTLFIINTTCFKSKKTLIMKGELLKQIFFINSSINIMIIKPKTRGFICTTAHPKGCSENVKQQVNYVKKKGPIKGAKNVLIIGSSTGYGLSSRIVSALISVISSAHSGVYLANSPFTRSKPVLKAFPSPV